LASFLFCFQGEGEDDDEESEGLGLGLEEEEWLASRVVCVCADCPQSTWKRGREREAWGMLTFE